jgi:hypothetical protein
VWDGTRFAVQCAGASFTRENIYITPSTTTANASLSIGNYVIETVSASRLIQECNERLKPENKPGPPVKLPPDLKTWRDTERSIRELLLWYGYDFRWDSTDNKFTMAPDIEIYPSIKYQREIERQSYIVKAGGIPYPFEIGQELLDKLAAFGVESAIFKAIAILSNLAETIVSQRC